MGVVVLTGVAIIHWKAVENGERFLCIKTKARTPTNSKTETTPIAGTEVGTTLFFSREQLYWMILGIAYKLQSRSSSYIE